MIRFFGHPRVNTMNHTWIYLVLGIIKLVMMVVLHSLLLLEMVKVVWVLVSPTFPPKKLIVVLMVVILCHLWVGTITLLLSMGNIFLLDLVVKLSSISFHLIEKSALPLLDYLKLTVKIFPILQKLSNITSKHQIQPGK